MQAELHNHSFAPNEISWSAWNSIPAVKRHCYVYCLLILVSIAFGTLAKVEPNQNIMRQPEVARVMELGGLIKSMY